MAVTVTYRTKYKIGDEVCIRSDLCDCVAYTSDDGAIVAFPPSNTYMYYGASAIITGIEKGRYILKNVAGVRIPGLWVDDMLESPEAYQQAEKAVRDSGWSVEEMKQMLPEVAAYFASTGMSLEQWEQEFRKGTKRIHEMIAFDRISLIAKLTRQAHDATEEGKDASHLFKQIADVASEKDRNYEDSEFNKKLGAIGAASAIYAFVVFLAAIAVTVSLSPYSWLSVLSIQWFFDNFFEYFFKVMGYMSPVLLILIFIALAD